MSYFDVGNCDCGMVSHNAGVRRHNIMCNSVGILLQMPDLTNIKEQDFEVLRASGVNVSRWECYKSIRGQEDPPTCHVIADEAVGAVLGCLPVSFTLVNPPLPASVLELLSIAAGSYNTDLRDALRWQYVNRHPRLTAGYQNWVDCVLALLDSHGLLYEFSKAMRDLGGTMDRRFIAG
jgi:hypothetical protein